MRRIGILAAVLVVSSLSVPSAAAGEVIGVVKAATGTASLVRAGQESPARPGDTLLAGDTLRTGPDGGMGVIFRDDSTLSIGPGTTVAIETFVFHPAERKFGFVARLARGTLAYVTGLIGKRAPESARLETPTATIGIRGTKVCLGVPGREGE